MTSEVVALDSPGVLCRCVIYLRGRRGWTQAQLAEAVGRSQQWVSRFESGRCEGSVGDAIAVLSALGADIAVRAVEAPQDGIRAHG
ncbi:MAG: helix-turn-helix transcriptional regulator [bacterium]|nr:helix-turn-helix transcriptional regulator [bacterium]MCY3961126.1 helix-turn-helix transcriptional regulator [bacterium]MCY4134569.1 helix-turn-helix transcriptional regulator [bacterium]